MAPEVEALLPATDICPIALRNLAPQIWVSHRTELPQCLLFYHGPSLFVLLAKCECTEEKTDLLFEQILL